jgi:hypothetical protein
VASAHLGWQWPEASYSRPPKGSAAEVCADKTWFWVPKKTSLEIAPHLISPHPPAQSAAESDPRVDARASLGLHSGLTGSRGAS